MYMHLIQQSGHSTLQSLSSQLAGQEKNFGISHKLIGLSMLCGVPQAQAMQDVRLLLDPTRMHVEHCWHAISCCEFIISQLCHDERIFNNVLLGGH